MANPETSYISNAVSSEQFQNPQTKGFHLLNHQIVSVNVAL